MVLELDRALPCSSCVLFITASPLPFTGARFCCGLGGLPGAGGGGGRGTGAKKQRPDGALRLVRNRVLGGALRLLAQGVRLGRRHVFLF